MGALIFSKGDLYKTFPIPFHLRRYPYNKDDLFGWKYLVKMAFLDPCYGNEYIINLIVNKKRKVYPNA